MAIVKLGVIVVGVRGTIGGIVFSQNKSGPNARIWSRGSNPRAPLQASQRGRLAAIPELWRALTPAQQAAWDTFAALPAQDQTNRLGETFSLSGFGFFTKCNTRLLAIGRATIQAVPVIARPAAPTITALQLPFLDAQGAFVSYPLNEFVPNFDLVLEYSQAISIGRQVSPTPQKTLLELQDPPQLNAGFTVPYFNRFGAPNSSLKGFTRVYRQTSEGLRSSAAASDFVATDSPAYVATATDYNGTTNWANRGAGMTGDADSKKFILSFWFRIDAGDGTQRFLLDANNFAAQFGFQTNNKFRLFCRDTAAATVLNASAPDAIVASANWHHFIASVDLSIARVQMAVDGVLVTPTISTGPVDSAIDFTPADWGFAASNVGASPFDGCLSEVYFNQGASIDLEASNALRPFISPDGLPMFLGLLGQLPTNAQPILYTSDGDASLNVGSGGAFVNNAALAACSTSP